MFLEELYILEQKGDSCDEDLRSLTHWVETKLLDLKKSWVCRKIR